MYIDKAKEVTAQPGRWLGGLSGSSWDHCAWDHPARNNCDVRGMNSRRGSGGCRCVMAIGPESQATEKGCPTQGKRYKLVHENLSFTR
ncbi:hypothetical protein KSD_59600 [Ktedonobacter sp. SOSP1-85]|nr:hypothetical protein KSD_59600 [Ktedonobacter sp. SOSP1-85]